MRKGVIIAALALSCLPSPKPVQIDYYVLGGGVPSAPGAASETTATLAINRVTLPGYLDRGEVATRTQNHITYSPTERWAEPLTDSVPKLLAQDLAAALGPDRIGVTSRSTAAPDLGLSVELERFERDGDGRVVLEARWWVRQMSEDRVIRSGTSRFEESPGGPTGDATAASLARAIDRLAVEIATAVHAARAAR